MAGDFNRLGVAVENNAASGPPVVTDEASVRSCYLRRADLVTLPMLILYANSLL
jgi:hypothetical protein